LPWAFAAACLLAVRLLVSLPPLLAALAALLVLVLLGLILLVLSHVLSPVYLLAGGDVKPTSLVGS
jgi:hypothetical protein